MFQPTSITAATVSNARRVRREDAIPYLAVVLARIDDVDFKTARAPERLHYLTCARIAVNLTKRGPSL